MDDIVEYLKELIFSLEFINRHKRYKTDFRRRSKLTAPLVICMILRLIKRSLSIECLSLLWNDDVGAVTKQAFSQARYKFKHTGFIELHKATVSFMYKDSNFGRWRGYRIIGGDGSSLRLPDSEDVVSIFGYHKPNGTGGKMPPIARVSLFVDLCLLGVVSARMVNWSTGEHTLAQEQLCEIVNSLNQDKLLFVYDRGYTSIKFIKQHVELGVDFLFRVPSCSYKKLWSRAQAGEIDFEDKLQGIKVRVVVFKLNCGQLELLITSIVANIANYSDICRLYTMRWQLEECYKKLKVNTELENFSGNNLQAVLQDFWAHMVMMNVAMSYINAEQPPLNPDNVPTHRINFPVFFGVMRDSFFKAINGEIPSFTFRRKLNRAMELARNKIKPGRSFSRRKMKIPKRHKVFFRTC